MELIIILSLVVLIEIMLIAKKAYNIRLLEQKIIEMEIRIEKIRDKINHFSNI